MLIYLHGFASSPRSFKARRFAEAFSKQGIELRIPDLNEGDFFGLTVSRQLALVDRLTAQSPPRSVALVGSSLGGYTAALYAAGSERVGAMVLMAPAFQTAERLERRVGAQGVALWERRGSTAMHHYGTGRTERLGFGFLQDARQLTAFPRVGIPTLAIHGLSDETVDPDVSRRFAAENDSVELELVASDHGLASHVDWIISRSLAFLEPYLDSEG